MDAVALRNAVDLLLDETGRNRADEAQEVWSALEQLIHSKCQVQEDLALVASTLLVQDDSLLTFLSKSLERQGKAGAKTREAVFKYLETFLQELGPNKAQKYSGFVIETCLFAFKREESNPTRASTFLPLQCILEWHLPGPIPDADTAAGLVKAYQGVYQRPKGLTGTVKGDILETLGLLLDTHPGKTFGSFDYHWLLEECSSVLQSQAKSNKSDANYMAGALAGLSSALAQCQESEGVEAQEVAYQHIIQNIQDFQALSRYHGLRAALSMLTNQAARFKDPLLRDYHDMVNQLTKMKSTHSNKDVREKANQALAAVFHQLAQQMLGQAEGEELQQLRNIHKILLGQLITVTTSPATSGKEVATAVAGIGELAAPTQRFFGQQGVAQLLGYLTPLVQQGNLLDQIEDLEQDKLNNEVALLVALAKVLAELNTADEATLQQCLHVTHRIVAAYRGLWPKQRATVHSALNILLAGLRPKAAALQSLLPRLVSMLLTYTLRPADDSFMTGPSAVAASQSEDAEEPWATYIQLWQAILLPPDKPNKATAGSKARTAPKLGLHQTDTDPQQLAAQQQAVYDALMRAVMDAMRNLDLEYHQAQIDTSADVGARVTSPDSTAVQGQGTGAVEGVMTADIGTGLTARNLTDMRAYINLADFTCALLPLCGPSMFRGWAYLLTLELVSASGQRPLLSGFYRMLKVTMALTAATGILHAGSGEEGEEESFEQLAGAVCKEVYRETLQGVIIACRRYKDELLEACLELLLSAPTTILSTHELVGPLQTALSLGLQYPPLAQAALSALERWELEQPTAIQAVAPQIVPLLDPYLLEIKDLAAAADASSPEDAALEEEPGAEEVAGEGVLQGERAGKQAYQALQADNAAAIARQKAARLQGLRALQPRIQAWLGRAADAADALVTAPLTSTNTALDAAAPQTKQVMARWDPDNKLGLAVPFPEEQTLMLWLDKTLPQVAELSERAPDRSTRVAGCEFLHAVTLWMIGMNARRPEGSREADFDAPPTQFHTIMQRLFPVLLTLACTAEPVARQLFQPLVMSLVHWLTRSARRESAETIVLLEAIMEGLSDSRSGARRELCANAAREFLVWSAKHIPMAKPKQGSSSQRVSHPSSNLNAASLLRRLFDRLVHPQTYQRLGAAQAMTRCADAMARGSDLNDVSDMFYLEALQKCVSALRTAEHDAEGSGTKSAVADALAECVRALRAAQLGADGAGAKPAAAAALAALVKVPLRRAHLADSMRKGRADRQGFVDLAAFLLWLWPLTRLPERYCRQMCMWLMDKLALLQMQDALQTDDAKGPVATWFEWQLQQPGTPEMHSLQRFLTVQVSFQEESSDGSMSLAHLRLWLQALEASVAWASWALVEGIITAGHLDLQRQPSGGGAEAALDKQAVMPALMHFLSMVPELREGAAEGISGSALAGCEQDCAKLAFKALTLLHQVTQHGINEAHWPALHNFLLAALLVPGHLGVPPAEADSARKLAIKAKDVIQHLGQLDSNHISALQERLADYLNTVIGPEGQGRLLVSHGKGSWQWGRDLAAAASLIQGLTLAADAKLPQGHALVPPQFKADLPDRFLSLAAGLKQGAPPQQHMAAEGALNLALRLGISTQQVLHHLMHSPRFYESYRPVVHGWVMFNADVCCPALCEALAGQQANAERVALAVLEGSLESLQRSKTAQAGRADPRQRSFCSALLLGLPKLGPSLTAHTSRATGTSCHTVFLQLLGRLLELDSKTVLDLSHPSFDFVFQSYLDILALRKSVPAEVQLRIAALQLLSSFLTLPAEQLSKLCKTVNELVNDVFPASSWEWEPGSTQSIDYARQLLAIMDSAVTAAELGLAVEPLLQALLPVLREMGESKGHVRQDALVTRLALVAAAPWKTMAARNVAASPPTSPVLPETASLNIMGAGLDPAKQTQATNLLEFALDQIFEGPNLPSPLRKACLRYLLLPCLRYSPRAFQHIAVQHHAKIILGIVCDKMAVSGHADGDRLSRRLAAYEVLRFVYERFSADEIKHEILGPSGGEAVNKTVLAAATKDVRGLAVEDELDSLAREARCAAFACGSALVSATQEKEALFAILFKGSSNSDPSGPWKQLLDVSHPINFSVEVDDSKRAAYRRASTSIKSVTERIRKDRAYAGSLMMNSTLGPISGSIAGFASQSLGAKISASQYSLGDALLEGSQGADSSAVPDTFQQSLDANATGVEDWQGLASMPVEMVEEEDSLAVVDDELDSHDCMLPLIHLVEKAARLFQASHAQHGAAMPEWMQRMHDAVCNGAVPRCARLFLVKAVLHVDRRHADRQTAAQQQATATSPGSTQGSGDQAEPSVFACFAHHWFPAIMAAVLGSAEEAAEQGIHYLLLDACLTCLGWQALFPAAHRGAGPGLEPQIKLAADSLMDYLVRASYDSKRQIVNNNFNLIKAFIYKWRAAVPVPLPALLSLLEATPAKGPGAVPDAKAKRKAAEQRCIGMKLFAAGLAYGQASALLTDDHCQAAVKHVLDCLATKGGQMLAQQSGECMGVLLAQLHAKSKQNLQVALDRGPEELEKEIRRILLEAQAKGQHDRFAYSVERLTAFYQPLLDSLRNPIMNALRQVTGLLQSLLLESLQRRAAKLSGLMAELRPVLPGLLASHNHALQNNALQLIRALLPAEADDAAGALLAQLVGFVQHSSSECRKQYFQILHAAWQLRPALHAVLRPPLLALLGDLDSTLRGEAVSFWDAALPQSAGLRLQALLQDSLKQPATLGDRLEAQWAQSTAALLLELPKGQRGYQAALFDRELAECRFAEYPIDTYGKPTLQTAPLFSPRWSASQDSSQSQDALGLAGPRSPGTQAPGATQYTQAGPGLVRATVGATVSQSISLALTLPREDAASLGFSSGTQRPQTDTLSERTLVRRRFHRSAGRTNEILGRLQRRKAAAGAQAVARERKVSLMRKYRTGELPDVQQLSIAAFLGPLGVMASRDASIACTTLEAMWTGILAAAQEGFGASGGSRSQGLTEGLRGALRQGFQQGPRHASYVACLQTFALADRGSTVDVDNAAKAATACASIQAGALQIEEQILFAPEPEAATPPNKRRAVSSRAGAPAGGHPVHPTRAADAAAWSALAGLYEQLSQDDVVQVIHAKHLSRCPASHTAINLLTGRKVDEAFKVYNALLKATEEGEAGAYKAGSQAEPMDTDTPEMPAGLSPEELLGGMEPLREEEDMWFRQQMKCMAALGMWEDMLSVVDNDIDGDESRLFVQEDNWDGSQYIRPFVRACLFQPSEQERLNSLMQQAAGNAHMTRQLASHAAVEVAAQAASCRQWDRCRALVGRGWGVFRQKWGSLHALSRARRFEALASLQPLTELQEVLDLLDRLPAGSAGTAGVEALQRLVERWDKRWPSVQQPSADACLTVINVRQLLLNALLEEWPRAHQHQGRTVFQILQGLQGEVMLGGAAALARQGFLDTAQDLLSQHRRAVEASHLPSLQAQLQLRTAQLASSPESPWLYSELESDLEQLSQLRPVARQSHGLSQHCRLLLLQANAHCQLSHGVPGGAWGGTTQEMHRTGQHLSAALLGYQAACGVHMGEEEAREQQCVTEAMAEAALKLSLLCSDLLQEEEAKGEGKLSSLTKDADREVKKTYGTLGGMLAHHLMQAMQLGGSAGKEAQLFVSRLLSVLGSDEAARQQVAKGWSKVPLHMLLPWSAQMLSLLEGPQGEALLPLLQALAKQFPQQMYFPFKLSSMHYGPEGQGRAIALKPLLKLPLMEEWSAALHDTTYPEQRWQNWHGRIHGLFNAGKKAEAGVMYKSQVYPDMIGNYVRGTRGSARGGSDNSPPATVNSAFAAKLKSKFEDAFGSSGDRIATMASKDFNGRLQQLTASIRQHPGDVAGKRDLARLSHWFDAFTERAGSGAVQGWQLLMPAMPSVQASASLAAAQAVHVAGFGKVVDVFSSKQRPKKLTIYGDDFRKYEWVVKGGEETRIDQRIEQLFDIMNGLMQRQPGAAAHSLQIRTYDVVPISASLGMLAFVPGTKPLKAVVTDPALMPQAAVDAADEAFRSFITSKGAGAQGSGPMYEKMFRAAGRREVVAKLQDVHSSIRWDSLREALLRAAGSPELFLSMRAAYIASLAAVSMGGYIAGVGDRHMDNFLLDMSSGALVPIDFGYSFGTGVQVLPIPELMPFRLTRQMTGVLQPHDALAMLQAPCILALTALRSAKDILQGVMEVFMREPLLDWQREAQNLKAKRSEPHKAQHPTSTAELLESEDMSHVSLKVDNARRKLEGVHPVHVMLSELTAKHAGKPHWQALQAIVKGDPGNNKRATFSSNHLTVEQQVESLLDQATDPNVLGRTWLGWKPWL